MITWLILGAIAFQVYMVTRCPSGLGMESVLAGRALAHGLVPYRDFQMHVGPVVPLIFAGLFAVPSLVWFALVFGVFNLLTAIAIYRLASLYLNATESALAAILFLAIIAFFDGNAWHVETIMTTFGVWAIYFAETKRKGWALAMVILATLTKQTGLVYGLCLLL